MRQPDSSKELPPRLSWHLRHVVCPAATIVLKLIEQGDEPGREGELGDRIFLALSAETDDHFVNIHIRQWQTSFAESATLLPSDHVAGSHPLRPIFQGGENTLMLRVGNAWFSLGRIKRYSEAFTRIDYCEARLDCFAHQDAYQFDFMERSVFGDLVTAYFSVPILPPVNVISDMRPGQLTRDKKLDA